MLVTELAEASVCDQVIMSIAGHVSRAGERIDQFWLLGSGAYSAQLAASLGLPFAFLSHFAPALLMEAAEACRSNCNERRVHPWICRPKKLVVSVSVSTKRPSKR